MKLVSAKEGEIMDITNRWYGLLATGLGKYKIRFSDLPGLKPASFHNVGYVQESGFVILTKGTPKQSGLMVFFNTKGDYTANTSGEISLLGGDAKMLVQQSYKGGCACYDSEELWHIKSPSIFKFRLSGGVRKGYGHRYCVITKDWRVVTLKRSELCQIIATDDDPALTEVVRQYVDKLHDETIESAFKTAENLENMEEAPQYSRISVKHFVAHWWEYSLQEQIRAFGIELPFSMRDEVHGVSRLESGILMPGKNPLVFVTVGTVGGGKSYGYEITKQEGLEIIASERNQKQSAEKILAIATSPDWHLEWVVRRQGKVVSRNIANAEGICSWSREAKRRSEKHVVPWYQRDTKELPYYFKESPEDDGGAANLLEEQKSPEKTPEEPQAAPEGGFSPEDLLSKFNSRRR